MGSISGRFRVEFGSIPGRFWIDLGSVRGRFGVGLGSIWGRFGIDLGSIWEIWGKFGVLAEMLSGKVLSGKVATYMDDRCMALKRLPNLAKIVANLPKLSRVLAILADFSIFACQIQPLLRESSGFLKIQVLKIQSDPRIRFEGFGTKSEEKR